MIQFVTCVLIDVCAAMTSHPPVLISDLAGHIERLKANNGVRFSAEYESIDPGQQLTWDAASQDDNKPKNRYANVIAYDHSRVQLYSLGIGRPHYFHRRSSSTSFGVKAIAHGEIKLK